MLEMCSRMSLGFCIVLAMGFATAARADVVTLKHGDRIEGIVVAVSGDKVGVISLRLDFGTISLPHTLIKAIEYKPCALADVEEKLARLRADDTRALYALHLEAKQRGLPNLAHEILMAIVRVDPDHPAAREALGHRRSDGLWVESEALDRSTGARDLFDSAPSKDTDKARPDVERLERRVRELEQDLSSLRKGIASSEQQSERERTAEPTVEDSAQPAHGLPMLGDPTFVDWAPWPRPLGTHRRRWDAAHSRRPERTLPATDVPQDSASPSVAPLPPAPAIGLHVTPAPPVVRRLDSRP